MKYSYLMRDKRLLKNIIGAAQVNNKKSKHNSLKITKCLKVVYIIFFLRKFLIKELIFMFI